MLRYVTTNEGKLREARAYLDDEVTQFDFDYPEVQADDVATVAAHGARTAYRRVGEPVLVDDAGLFVEGFDGFPGPYSAFVEDTLGVETVYRLADAELEDTSASFRCVLAYCDGEPFDATPDPVDREDRVVAAATGADGAETDAGDGGDALDDDPIPVKLFEGVVRGELVAPRGDGGFGYDPIFEYDGTTMAEMDATEKNAVSHRGRALEKFAEWVQQR
ncbi:non-canonical purine NTP pyrophosphatase [Halobaculum sp. MBLA0147]|uniref:non-canonical purine NTP pyrophosphatase n=1 Tax=Halobaculum sp. MBLA0147 TaxID=3079934 RepID=UPI0035232EB3